MSKSFMQIAGQVTLAFSLIGILLLGMGSDWFFHTATFGLLLYGVGQLEKD